MKGSGLSPQDSSKLRVKVPLWLSWLNTSVSKPSQANIYIYETQGNIKYVIDINNKNMQDINTSEREISNRKHGRIVLRFEHTCSTSPPSPLWRISTKIDLARSLGATTPTTSSVKNSWTHKSLTYSRKNNTASTLACRGHTSTPSSLKNSSQYKPASLPPQIQMEHLVISFSWSPKTNSHNMFP